jgi:hypothetical protein
MKKEKADLLRDKYPWFFKSKMQTLRLLKDHYFDDEEVGKFGTLFDISNETNQDTLLNIYEKFSALPDFISLQPITKEKATVFYLKYETSDQKNTAYKTIYSSNGVDTVEEDSNEIPEIRISIASKQATPNRTIQLDDMVAGILSNLDMKDIPREKINNFTRMERMRISNEIFINSKTGGGNRDIKFSIAGLETHLIVYSNEVTYLAAPVILSPCEIDKNNVTCYLEMINSTYGKLITSDNPYTGKVEIEKF